jgi:hypothetical protein
MRAACDAIPILLHLTTPSQLHSQSVFI